MPVSKTQHTTIGVMITEDDRDIAAWFNMMRGHNASKWVAGMLAAWKLGKTLDAGGCTVDASNQSGAMVGAQRPLTTGGLLFGSGRASAAAPKYHYGWTVKGPAGEYIVGSVVNVSIARKEIQPIVQELRNKGVQLAPFVKSLIRSNMKVEAVNRLPDISALNEVFTEYRLSAPPIQQEEPAAPEPPAAPKLTRHIDIQKPLG